MAVYKVLQDIEGEDKLIAWLTPKQTIYAAIVVVSGVLGFVLGRINIVLAIPWLIPIIIFGFLAAPLGRDQPNDIWLAAQIRFFLKPRKRLWDQSGMQELVQITVPKKIERIFTDGLDQGQVRSRLRALSATIDSRGWAIKNSNVNLSVAPQFSAQFQQAGDDRLVGTSAMPQDIPISDVSASEDILDEQNNDVAQRFDQQIKQQQQARKQALRQAVQKPAEPVKPTQPGEDFYFLNDAAHTSGARQTTDASSAPAAAEPLATFAAQVVAPGAVQAPPSATASDSDPAAQALLDKLHHDQAIAHDIAAHSHQKVIQTPAELAAQAAEEQRLMEEKNRQALATQRAQKAQATKMAPTAIIKKLSTEGSDLKISSLAAAAKHAEQVHSEPEDGEVVVSLR